MSLCSLPARIVLILLMLSCVSRAAFAADDDATQERVQQVLDVLADDEQDWRARCAFADDQVFAVRRQLVNELATWPRKDVSRRLWMHYLKNDPALNVREGAASALVYVKSMDQEVVDALVDAVREDSTTVKLYAVQSLGFGEFAKGVDETKANKTLLSAMEHQDLQVAKTAVRALGKRQHQPALKRVVEFFQTHGRDHSVAATCAEALSYLDGADAVMLDACHEAMQSQNWNIRYWALTALQRSTVDNKASFLVYHLAGELKRANDDLKSHAVGPRNLKEMSDQLKELTSVDHQLDVNRWINWYESHSEDLPRWSMQPVKRVSKRLQAEFEWHLAKPEWGRSVTFVESLKAKLREEGKFELDGYRLRRSLVTLSQETANAPVHQQTRVTDLLPTLELLKEDQATWSVSSATVAWASGVSPGKSEAELLDDAIMALDQVAQQIR